VPLREARGEPRAGAALDWMYAVGRALSLEVAVWGPQVEAAAEVSAQDARFAQGAGAKTPHAIGLSNGRAAPGENDKLWANWLDNLHGGLGFVDWHPVEIGHGTTALVGGWEPRTVDNPPAESLARSLKGVPEFVRNLGTGMPRLDVRVASAVRDGEVCKIRARVRNLGLLPTGLAGGRASATGEPSGLALELALPAGAQLLAGRANIARERLLGGESTDEYEWVVLAPEGSTFTLRASSDWTLPVAREIKP
jgi:hypothetical protein